MLLNHDSNQLPIGKGNVYIRNDKLTIDVEFDSEDPRAKEVERKAKKGIRASYHLAWHSWFIIASTLPLGW